ncbi:ABC transporter ATP-binding protein/permease [Allopusillimonas ginsengisoli]|uniref:ABC transporter ATP-binding protein/permease n=1 Tax=Allopusillimonas ginsengisoli TaxID=453575 RepID=UPI00101FC807|nr:ABC transporter ATP-binding protein/permease [Allopusillimonas ginsengisoli]TEA77720.1 ABC transporter ATP-binding protein/permease [Allopusillimonas ginsengisoli]
MNWNNTLTESGIWVAQAYGITLAVAIPVVWILTRFTAWGRQFWRLSAGYFSPRRDWRPLAVLALMLLLTLCAVRLQVLFSNWYNTMYTALQRLDEHEFWTAMALFGLLAVTHVLRSLLDFYLQQAFIIRWRVWLNEKLLTQWIDGQSYYRTQYLPSPVDNPDQRIQQDVSDFVQGSLTLSLGVVNALVSTFAFTLILWTLSGPVAIGSIEIPRGMVFLVFIYVITATVFAIWIGRPLIQLNFLNERFNADYRYALVRLREYAESIAFYAGEKVEGAILRTRFAHVISNAWAIVHRSLKFLGFNFSITQAAVVFPFILQAPRFFSRQISLGDLMQTAQAFGQLQDNLSFFRNAYDAFATYRATLNRLSGFTRAIGQVQQLPSPNLHEHGDRLAARNLTVTTPNGDLILQGLNLEIVPGAPLLIRGPSGAGKTTLLRSIAGLWPYCTGDIYRPEHDTLFLAQKPYLPLGTLRSALYYPQLSSNVQNTPTDSDGSVYEILNDIQLGHLAERLDEIADWSRILSLGEQQRLAFGRLLLLQPKAALLDEATSALDEGLEAAMYRLVLLRLPQLMLASVGHRSTLLKHHTNQLVLAGDKTGRWEFSP